jgi:predicted amidohydrolase
MGKRIPPPDPAFLERAWSTIAAAAGKSAVAVVLGTERFFGNALLVTALVINQDGTMAGSQDKVQIDPSEEGIYSPGAGRRVFQCGLLLFGVASGERADPSGRKNWTLEPNPLPITSPCDGECKSAATIVLR